MGDEVEFTVEDDFEVFEVVGDDGFESLVEDALDVVEGED